MKISHTSDDVVSPSEFDLNIIFKKPYKVSKEHKNLYYFNKVFEPQNVVAHDIQETLN